MKLEKWKSSSVIMAAREENVLLQEKKIMDRFISNQLKSWT